MTGSRRREEIVSKIKSSEVPVPGKELAKVYDVSRQVIVQDIALIRAAGYDIISTNRGYILNAPHTVTRVFKVSHTDEQMEDELCSIVDLGGKVVNVMINHRIYGHMEAPLDVHRGEMSKNSWKGSIVESPVHLRISLPTIIITQLKRIRKRHWI